MNNFYREEILEHWQNPSNFGVIDDADLVIEKVNPLCGDEVTFYFKFSTSRHSGERNDSRIKTKRKDSGQARMTSMDNSRQDLIVVKDVKFTGSGCAISIASASILSENIRNKKVSALSRITGEDVLKLIGGSVAPARLRCAFLALEALRKVQGKPFDSAQGKLK